MDDFIARPIAISVFVLLLCFPFIVYKTWKKDRKPCLQFSKIISIGGCDSGGKCGVKLENGSLVQDYYPVLGKEVCVKKE